MYNFNMYGATANNHSLVDDEWWKNQRGYECLTGFNGANKVKFYKKMIDSKKYNNWIANYDLSHWHTVYNNQQRHDAWLKLLNDTDPEKITLKPMIVFINRPDWHIGPAASKQTGKYDPDAKTEDVQLFPYVTLKPGYSSASIFGGPGSYIIIKGTFRQHDEANTPYPLDDGKQNGKLKRDVDEKYNNEAFQWARLKWGNYYWNGNYWTKDASDFKLYFGEGNPNDPRSRTDEYTFKVKDYWDKDLKIQDTARTDFGCDDDGYYIPAPEDKNLQGNAEFILYANRDMYGASDHGHWKPKDNNRYSRYYNYCQFITGLSIKTYKAASDLTGETDDSDTIYYNEIDSDNVIEGPEITFKVCTYDNKRSTYSMVDYLDSKGDSQYIEFTYNKALNSEQNLSNSYGSGNVVAYMRQEEHYVYKMVS